MGSLPTFTGFPFFGFLANFVVFTFVKKIALALTFGVGKIL
jgi:hypothetical protein